jgi:farnesyl diphosphate synthase
MALAGVADTSLGAGLARIAREIDAAFDNLLPLPQDSRTRLVEAMRYAAIGGGKRLRPLLLTATAEMYGVVPPPGRRAGRAGGSQQR